MRRLTSDTFTEAEALISSMAKGDGGAGQVIAGTARQLIGELPPHKEE